MTSSASRFMAVVAVVGFLLTSGCGRNPASPGVDPSSLSCAGSCPQGAQLGTTTFNAGPRVHRLQPDCDTIVVEQGTSVPFAVSGEFLQDIDGNGVLSGPVAVGQALWYLDNVQTWYTGTAGPFSYTRYFGSVGTFALRVDIRDASGNRLSSASWTVQVVADPSASGALGGSGSTPYYCHGAPAGSLVDVVRGESRRVELFAYEANAATALLDRCDWYWDAQLVDTQLASALPNSTTRGATCHHDVHESALGMTQLEARPSAGAGPTNTTSATFAVTVRDRGRSLDVEDIPTLVAGDDPALPRVAALLAFVDSHGVNAVALHGVGAVLAGDRCLTDPSDEGCMPLATLIAALQSRDVEVSAGIDSAQSLTDVLAFEFANPGYFDGLYTRCPFWDAANACFGGTFEDADPLAIDSYMELLRAMEQSGLVVGARVVTNKVEKLEAIRDVADRIYLDASAPGRGDCHFKQVEAMLQAVSTAPQNPVEVYPIFTDELQQADACAQGEEYSAFEDWEEDFYARLRGEGGANDPCTWTGARPEWLDGIRVTGFHYQDYATLSAKLDDTDCDGIDDDCDGTIDDGFVIEATACGDGGCGATGYRTCSAGAVTDSCVALPPQPDTLCDGIDDDCDGLADDDFVSMPVCDYAYAPVLCGMTTCVDGLLGDDIARPECNLDLCGVSDQCMTPICVDFECAEEPLADGTSCPDSPSDICVAGTCVQPGCGNGYREAGEGCDDGNLADGDACGPGCTTLIAVIDGSADGSYEPIPPDRTAGLTADGNGALLAVWIRDFFDHEELHIRRYNRGGADLDAGATTALDDALFRPSNAHPVVAGLADGGWVVAWSAIRLGERNIVYRIVEPDGSLGLERIANEQRIGTQWKPSVASNGDGFVIAWVDTSDSVSDPFDGVSARRFDAYGLARGPEFTLANDGGDWEGRVQVAGSWSSDNWIAVWVQGFDGRTYARRFVADAPFDPMEFAVAPYHADFPTVVSLTDGRYAVAFESWSDLAASPIQVQPIEPSGMPIIDSPLSAADAVFGGWSEPSAFAWENGEFGVSANIALGDPSGYRIYGDGVLTLTTWDFFYLAGHIFSNGEGEGVFTKVPDGLWATWIEPASDPTHIGLQWSASYVPGSTP